MFRLEEKILQIKECCFKWTENRLAGMENWFKNMFLLDDKTAWQEYLKNQKKSLAVAMIIVLNRLLYNLNNGFHQQEKKF